MLRRSSFSCRVSWTEIPGTLAGDLSSLFIGSVGYQICCIIVVLLSGWFVSLWGSQAVCGWDIDVYCLSGK